MLGIQPHHEAEMCTDLGHTRYMARLVVDTQGETFEVVGQHYMLVAARDNIEVAGSTAGRHHTAKTKC
jgi:hypothetical protein